MWENLFFPTYEVAQRSGGVAPGSFNCHIRDNSESFYCHIRDKCHLHDNSNHFNCHIHDNPGRIPNLSYT